MWNYKGLEESYVTLPSMIVEVVQGTYFMHIPTSSPSSGLCLLYLSTNIYCGCPVSQSKIIYRQKIFPRADVLVGEKHRKTNITRGWELCREVKLGWDGGELWGSCLRDNNLRPQGEKSIVSTGIDCCGGLGFKSVKGIGRLECKYEWGQRSRQRTIR